MYKGKNQFLNQSSKISIIISIPTFQNKIAMSNFILNIDIAIVLFLLLLLFYSHSIVAGGLELIS